ncbi:alpha/beta hydrolase [Rhodoferax sp. TS-BS-61-7]|uniref:RBBP9/YdeN family alpha/beta hydrolase n=1 Tax=Rhodoferax sp. TS-BS-61-7 TaxID=2094194 RepID=UPI000CF6CB67|nr:alpha/beta fold hydrolase [Rhodoferax sp. TS-BS-61-7]PQA79292.1 alpha/beta hydrolase [Rhodoferax sp. TS-BS-61-7]
MSAPTILILPGWQNSGPAHWQSRWEALHGYTRVQQHDWMQPLRGDWMMQLEEAVLAAPTPVVLVAHSLGCMLTAAWAQHSQNTHKVQAAFLVAPGDPEREELRAALKSWWPVVMDTLPFAAELLGSQNDPYCTYARAQQFAAAWGADLVDYGAAGHINADTGLGDWADGQARLQALITRSSARTA